MTLTLTQKMEFIIGEGRREYMQKGICDRTRSVLVLLLHYNWIQLSSHRPPNLEVSKILIQIFASTAPRKCEQLFALHDFCNHLDRKRTKNHKRQKTKPNNKSSKIVILGPKKRGPKHVVSVLIPLLNVMDSVLTQRRSLRARKRYLLLSLAEHDIPG